ncbi:MAG: hypothetical protein H6502_02155 [Candidatus Woesearchaeota archaeon]|nr:MAG: hypothetical protein H6502_02155 [Candidatus Woesearchaeota archaeon]
MKYRLKKYLHVTKKEHKELHLVAVLIAAVMSANFFFTGEVGRSFFLLIFYYVIAFIFLVAKTLMQKIRSLQLGYEATYESNITSLIVGIFFSVLSYGLILPVFPGTVRIEVNKKLLLGRSTTATFAYRDLFSVGMSGALTLLGFILLLHPLAFGVNATLFMPIINLLFLLLIFSLVPIPIYSFMSHKFSLAPVDGLHLIRYSRTWYVFILAFTIFLYFFIATQTFSAWLFALIASAITYFIYKKYFDFQLSKG